MTGADLAATSRCPRGAWCESCGAARRDLRVRALTLGGLGVACMTLCPPCSSSGVTPPVAASTAARLVAEHRQHLGHAAPPSPDQPLSRQAVRRALGRHPTKEN